LKSLLSLRPISSKVLVLVLEAKVLVLVLVLALDPQVLVLVLVTEVLVNITGNNKSEAPGWATRSVKRMSISGITYSRFSEFFANVLGS